jgi:hypothetical protein
LADHQRRDKALRRFMKTKTGLYDVKFMSIREVDDQQIFCFKRKAYIPVKLRTTTIRYYKEQHADADDDDALAALTKNCIWPDLDVDFYNEGFVAPTAMSILQQATSLSCVKKEEKSTAAPTETKPEEEAAPSPPKATVRRCAV